MGGVALWLILRARADRAVALTRVQLGHDAAAGAARAEEASRRAAELHTQLASRELALARLQGDLAAAREEGVRVQAELEAERKASESKLELLRDAEAKLRDTFTALSSEALRHNNQSFIELARASLAEFQQSARTDLDVRQKSIEELIHPIRESLSKVDGTLQLVEQNRVGTQSAVTEQLRSLHLAQQSLQTETGRLVQALRSPNVRGQWGELQLRRVVEAAGMVEYCDFDLKEFASVDGVRLTPDMIVRLPGGKNVVVDAKVPSSAYLDAMETDDETQRDARLKDHARQFREHIVRLGNKTYWQHFQPAPDMVIMFVPGETLISVAMQRAAAFL